MIITEYLTQKLQEYVAEKYLISDFNFEIIKTKKEFDGLYTVVLFPLIPRIKKSPKEIQHEDFMGFLSDLHQQNISARSQSRIISSIKSFYKFLLLEKEININPSELIESPKIGI